MRKKTRIPSSSARPAAIENQFGLAFSAQKSGHLDKAEALYKKILAVAPKHVHALHLLGVLYYQRGRLEEAEQRIRQALELQKDASFYLNLALVLQQSKKTDDAIEAFENCLKLNPSNIQACNNLGNIYTKRAQSDKGEQLYRKAIEADPDYALAYQNLGIHLRDSRRSAEAEPLLRTALELDPKLNEARYTLANIYEDNGYFSQASQLLEAVNYIEGLFTVWRKQVNWAHLDDIDAQLRQKIAAGDLRQMKPWPLLNLPGLTAHQHRDIGHAFATKRWSFELETPPLIDPALCPPAERLKIGYLSSDFYDHATMHLLAGVLEQHDRQALDITLYSHSPKTEGEFFHRLMATGLRLCSVHELSDQQAAETIANDGIHLLIDLKGYTTNARMGITARRPAPVIVSWLGYPGTLGHPRLADFIIGDAVVTPPQHKNHFSEILALMPDSYQPNDALRHLPAAPERSAVGLPEEGVVFCSFNQLLKLNPSQFDLWCRLLHAVPGSVLWLLDPKSEEAKNNLCQEAVRRGIEEHRILFAPFVSQSEHMARLQLADIALDTFPCNSHTTASDALWAGVPLITRQGELFASRVAASLLTTHGFPELIVDDDEAFFALALTLAQQPDQRQNLRNRLQQARTTSPLFDTTRFTHHLERLYRAIWTRHCEAPNDRSPVGL